MNWNFLKVYLTDGSTRERQYAVENTVFLFAQLLGWLEAIRLEIQFLNFEEDLGTKLFGERQLDVHEQLRTDKFGRGFRLFAGEQRAVGELMIEQSDLGIRCLGFAAFITRRERALDSWLDPLREDVKEMAVDEAPSQSDSSGSSIP